MLTLFQTPYRVFLINRDAPLQQRLDNSVMALLRRTHKFRLGVLQVTKRMKRQLDLGTE